MAWAAFLHCHRVPKYQDPSPSLSPRRQGGSAMGSPGSKGRARSEKRRLGEYRLNKASIQLIESEPSQQHPSETVEHARLELGPARRRLVKRRHPQV